MLCFARCTLIVARTGTTSLAGFWPTEAMEVAVSIMSKLQKIAIVAGTAVGLGAISSSAGELPQYEAAGFPISLHQITVLRYAKRTHTRALAATRKRHAHMLANAAGTDIQNDAKNRIQNEKRDDRPTVVKTMSFKD